ncbi:hypothetical protein KKB44_02495 [Candidatus Micrarchaeota archaeon]|nr:hypothetical protein [Candidatus Micrarchaeota archaeon]
MDEYEKIFQKVTSIILGKPLENYKNYEKWLFKNVTNYEYGKSVISEEHIYLPPFDFYSDVKHNIVTIEEAYGTLGKKQISQQELESLSFSNAKKVLSKISTTTPNTIYGESSKMKDCTFYYSSHSCYKTCGGNRSKGCVCSFWPRASDYAIGCYYAFSCQFCLKCYNSNSLTRCFEVSDSNKCSDCYFCHNCENLVDCMFCFNAKNLRYAIANVPLGPKKYQEIKEMILDEIVEELEKTKNLKLDIYSIGD